MPVVKLMQSGLIVLFLLVMGWWSYETILFKRWDGVVGEIKDGYSPVRWSEKRASHVNNWLGSMPYSCRWRDRSKMSILQLGLLDRTLALPTDYDDRAKAFAHNIAFAKNTAVCDPLRHINWVNLARLEAIMIFDRNRQAELLGFARALAPTQLASLIERISAYGAMPGINHLLQLEPVQKDFLTMFRYGRNATLVNVLKSLQQRNVDLSPILSQATAKQMKWLQAKGIKQ